MLVTRDMSAKRKREKKNTHTHTKEEGRGGWISHSPGNVLAVYDALAVLAVNLGLPLLQLIQRVQLGRDAEYQAHGPEPVPVGLDGLGLVPLLDAGGVGQRGRVKGQVAGVANLLADARVAQEGVDGLGVVGGLDSGLEVLDVLADAEDLARQAELLLGDVPGGDLGLGGIGAQEVPGVEAGEVLDGAEELVAADGGGDEAEVVLDGGVVHERVDDHFDGCSVDDLGVYLSICFVFASSR